MEVTYENEWRRLMRTGGGFDENTQLTHSKYGASGRKIHRNILPEPGSSVGGGWGGYGQKGVDFQRYWSILRIIELKQDGSTDFLLLFESIQDVAEFDSETAPSRIDIYQIKKKDGGEWSFNELTGMLKPDGRKKKVAPALSKVEKSPLGKLYKAGLAIQQLDANAHFVSNAGCDFPLGTSGSASSLLKCLASELDTSHASSLAEGLALLHTSPGTAPDRFAGNGLSNLPDLRCQGCVCLRNGRRHMHRRRDRSCHLVAPLLQHTAVGVVHDPGGFAHRIVGLIRSTSILAD